MKLSADGRSYTVIQNILSCSAKMISNATKFVKKPEKEEKTKNFRARRSQNCKVLQRESHKVNKLQITNSKRGELTYFWHDCTEVASSRHSGQQNIRQNVWNLQENMQAGQLRCGVIFYGLTSLKKTCMPNLVTINNFDKLLEMRCWRLPNSGVSNWWTQYPAVVLP